MIKKKLKCALMLCACLCLFVNYNVYFVSQPLDHDLANRARILLRAALRVTKSLKRSAAIDNNPDIGVWPYPQFIASNQTFYSIDSTQFRFVVNASNNCELVSKAVQRYQQLTFLEDCSLVNSRTNRPNTTPQKTFSNQKNYDGVLDSIVIFYDTCESLPHLDMDESYDLVIDANMAAIYAKTNWGIIRALETFSQLVSNVASNQFLVNKTVIEDFPRFTHRGLLVDTSRHFISTEKLYENLDAMSYNKLNVFHWHITDDQSFPYVSSRFPQLSIKGAYNPETHVYNATDVKNIIEYARERGIRVVVEFDTPGHAKSWGKGQPGLLTQCYGRVSDGTFGPINPTKNSTYSFIAEFFAEVAQTFADQYLHLGGDEVDIDCWRSNPQIKQFMFRHGIYRTESLFSYYMVKLLDMVANLNRSYIVWEEVFNHGVDIKADTVVHVWKSTWQELNSVTAKGFRAILSSCWYLDGISYGHDWQTYYNCEPHSFIATDARKKLIIGGEAAMWDELVDGSNLMSRIWPRASATAERLWSAESINDTYAADSRFNKQRCVMQQRGIRAHPNDGPSFCKCDYAL